MLTAWFDRLVKNKMAGVAVCVSGIAISCFLLAFAKIFTDFIFSCVSGVGLLILCASGALYIYASYEQVRASVENYRSQLLAKEEGRTGNPPKSNEQGASHKKVTPPPNLTELEAVKHNQDSREPGPDIAGPSLI
jgi:hypothetical protein